MPSNVGISRGLGPAPKKQTHSAPRRLNDQGVRIKLPAGGRPGPPPPWPLDDFSEVERKLWAEVWKMPHAMMWERLGSHRQVARYVRVLIEAEQDGMHVTVKYGQEVLAEDRAVTAARTAALQLEDRLGLNPLSMLRMGWVVDTDEEAAEGGPDPEVPDVRSRLQLVAAGGGD